MKSADSYTAGARARYNGKPFSSNPYKRPKEHTSWSLGWVKNMFATKGSHGKLGTYLYTFPFREEAKYEEYKKRLKKTGKVTIVYVNNRYAFEYKRDRKG